MSNARQQLHNRSHRKGKMHYSIRHNNTIMRRINSQITTTEKMAVVNVANKKYD